MQLPITPAPTQNSPVGVSISASPNSNEVLITLTPPIAPSDGKRAPLDICCVIDVSGSMQTDAPVPGDAGGVNQIESAGLSVLDIVKHSLRTIVSTMNDDDRIALVSFSSSAKVVCNLTATNAVGKEDVLAKVKTLTPDSATNLWDGLKAGMKLLDGSTDSDSPRLSTLFILTDGMPNIVPPRGHIPMLETYLESKPNRKPFSINTFGFGYSLDSSLLLDIARIGGGGYFFIPDSGMVGTVFIHAVANTYSTYAPRVKLNIEVPEDIEVSVKGAIPSLRTSWGIQIEAGDIQFGQSRDFVVVLSRICLDISASISYRPFSSKNDITALGTLTDSTGNAVRTLYHKSRLELVELLYSVYGNNTPATLTALESVETALLAISADSDAAALAKDIAGECVLALKKPAYERWGCHYLPSLAKSHQRQQCANFKDPGLQVYGRGSSIFNEERNKLDSAFDNLPPPTASRILRAPGRLWRAGPPPAGRLPPLNVSFVEPPIMSRGLLLNSFESPPMLSGAFGVVPSPDPQFLLSGMAPVPPRRGRYCGSQPGFRAPASVSPLCLPPAPLSSAPMSSGVFGAVTPPDSQSWLFAKPRCAQDVDEPPSPQSVAPSASTPISMSMWNSPSGPCFGGNSTVDVPNGSVLVKELVRGMDICTLKGVRKVAAVVRTRISSGYTLLSTIDGLQVTPYHPILYSGAWVFPKDVVPADLTPCDAIYSILLSNEQEGTADGHSICVGGTWCVTLGHGIVSGDDVRAHAFLGDYERVLASITKLPGFYDHKGVVACTGTERQGGMISGFIGEDKVPTGNPIFVGQEDIKV